MLSKAVSQPVREVYMTIKEALLAEGEKRGLAKGEKRGLAKGEKRGLAEGEKRGLAKGEKRGLAKGRARSVLELLEARSVPIPTPVRKRVLSTRDEPLLQRWLALALTVSAAEQIFDTIPARAS
jgi:flagellar biosynthesis/type III secretory pathway protein FliH